MGRQKKMRKVSISSSNIPSSLGRIIRERGLESKVPEPEPMPIFLTKRARRRWLARQQDPQQAKQRLAQQARRQAGQNRFEKTFVQGGLPELGQHR